MFEFDDLLTLYFLCRDESKNAYRNLDFTNSPTQKVIVDECENFLKFLQGRALAQHHAWDFMSLTEAEKECVEKNVQLLSLLLDHIREQLNIGHWRSVSIELRIAYCHVSSLKVLFTDASVDVY